ncbi:MAG TPA: hypothetical protein VKD71_10410 [Gemmataceae bacterium]|nr:hypothetical protein [Gemmataceae bacterium]
MERGDPEGAKQWLREARGSLASVPAGPEVGEEELALAQIEEYLVTGAWQKFRKHAKYQAHQRRSSKPY